VYNAWQQKWLESQVKNRNKIFHKVNCRPGSRIKPNLNKTEQPKDYGINTKANTQEPSFIPFPFGLGTTAIEA
jgi:hypothetical protein